MTDQQTARLRFEFAKALEQMGSDENMIKAALENKDEGFKEMFSIKIQQFALDSICHDRGLHQFYIQNTSLVNETVNKSAEMFLEHYVKKVMES